MKTLAHYRRLLDERGWDWGHDHIDLFRWVRFSLLGPIFDAFAATGDWPNAVRSMIGHEIPAGVVVVRIDQDGRLRADVGPARPAIAGSRVRIDVVIDSAAGADLFLAVADRKVRVAALGAAVETIELDGGDPVFTVVCGDEMLSVHGAIRTSPAAELRLLSPRCTRWSVTDATGGGWFPEDLLPKWDVHHRPFFHGHDLTLAVPAEPLHVACTRGLEFERVELDVHPAVGETATIACDPPRLFDPAAEGWYGGDLHVHMNYRATWSAHPPTPPACNWARDSTWPTWSWGTARPRWSTTATCSSNSPTPICRGRPGTRWRGWAWNTATTCSAMSTPWVRAGLRPAITPATNGRITRRTGHRTRSRARSCER
jgi:hypothetical protein